MHTLYPYQVRLAISVLTTIGDELETIADPAWHTVATAAACLENILHGKKPTDVADVTARLKDITPDTKPRRSGKSIYAAVSMASVMLDGYRLGLIDIRPDLNAPVWGGIDLAAGADKSAWRTIHA